MTLKIGLVDDHQLFLRSLGMMLDSLTGFEVVVEALNGKDLQEKMAATAVEPDLILVDVNMPCMNGIATCSWLQQEYPSIKLIALSMNDNDMDIVGMFRAGCSGYLLKDVHPALLRTTLLEVYHHGAAPHETIRVNPARLLGKNPFGKPKLTGKEQQFLELACSDRTYKQIASDMQVSERTVDGYRETIFRKLGVQSRVGMCLEALRTGMVNLPTGPLGSLPQ